MIEQDSVRERDLYFRCWQLRHFICLIVTGLYCSNTHQCIVLLSLGNLNKQWFKGYKPCYVCEIHIRKQYYRYNL